MKSPADQIGLNTFADIAADFRLRREANYIAEAEWFGAGPKTFEEAISTAALSQVQSRLSGKVIRHSHQARLNWSVLNEARLHLLARAEEIKTCGKFEELFDLTESTVLPIVGAGEMLVYDVAHRIALYMNVSSDSVYLHSGTRNGAIALRMDGKQRRFHSANSTLPWQP